jgi:hypothetical protein
VAPSFPIKALRDASSVAGDAAALRRRAARSGYLYFRGAIPPDVVLAVRNRVLESCARRGWLDPTRPLEEGTCAPWSRFGAYDEPWVELQQEIMPLDEVDRIRRDPFVLSVLERLFREPPLDRRGDTVRIMSPAARDLTTPPHQDRFYVRQTDRLWTVWLPLGDCPTDLGGLAVLPGSHRDGLLEHSGDRDAGGAGVEMAGAAAWASADYRCGDVLMFSCLTLHRALPNASANRLRVSADFRYVPESVGAL